MIKIGIGIVTCNREHLLKALLNSIREYTDFSKHEYLIFVADDTNHKLGIAQRKNQCLKSLEDCDYIFLLEDDVKITKKGWAEFFINTNQNHLLFLTSEHKKTSEDNGLEYYSASSGVFMFLTKECLKKVGGFNSNYKTYGYEHAGYSERIFKAGLTPYSFVCATGSGEYLYAMDYDKTIRHKSVISDKERQDCLEINKYIYQQDIQQIFQPLI